MTYFNITCYIILIINYIWTKYPWIDPDPFLKPYASLDYTQKKEEERKKIKIKIHTPPPVTPPSVPQKF